jgi:rare lipoprotein A
MRRLLKLVRSSIHWGILLFALTPGLQGPVAARAMTPMPKKRPIRVWSGVASWYGEEFQGRETANGETFDMYGATAASLSLPFGSLVRLVNTRTGKSQIVRINDRGPYVEGREMDVSYEVARRLGIDSIGVSRLRMELIEVPTRRD